jgi:hypothetical protein
VSSISSRNSDRAVLVAVCALAISGCALQSPQPELYAVDELSDVPFFPQTDYDCGPAALATILNSAGVPVSVAELIDAVYIEGIKGSLQVELLAATRRQGLIPVPVGASAMQLLEEIEAGRPVLVMQNLGFTRAPVWHYAVVVGYAADRNRFVLRSGAEARRMERESRFLKTWRRADNWGFVAVAAGQIPASATPDSYMRALLSAASQLEPASADRAYAAALSRWPNEPLVLFLAATREQTRDNLTTAASLYRRLLTQDPAHAAGRNNFANVLLAQGCPASAAREARIALDAQGPDGDFVSAIRATMQEIEAATTESATSCSASG